jgi:hypothetical protein
MALNTYTYNTANNASINTAYTGASSAYRSTLGNANANSQIVTRLFSNTHDFKDVTKYNLMRGVPDFGSLVQFNPYETGYAAFVICEMPKFMQALAEQDESYKKLVDNFAHILEYEFRGLQGLPNLEGQAGTITDGINELQYINRVTMDTSVQVSMEVIEKSGSTITKFAEYYLTGIKDRMTQAKTYHGLIKNNLLDPGLENEVFTFLYYVTDNTMLRLERSVLLANAQLTTAELGSLYNSTRGTIDNVSFTLNFNCFPVYGVEVDKAAKILLQDITGVKTYYNSEDKFNPEYEVVTINHNDDNHKDRFGFVEQGAHLDSNDYMYGVLADDVATRGTGVTGPTLANARKAAEENKADVNYRLHYQFENGAQTGNATSDG